jgi:hypothetical protein
MRFASFAKGRWSVVETVGANVIGESAKLLPLAAARSAWEAICFC